MNTMMYTGVGVIVLGIVLSLISYYKLVVKPNNQKFSVRMISLAILISFTAVGLTFTTIGDKQRVTKFNKEQLALLQSKKPYSEFTEEDDITFLMLEGKFLRGKDIESSEYYDLILQWAIDDYMTSNSHRTDLTPEIVKTIVLNNWETERSSY